MPQCVTIRRASRVASLQVVFGAGAVLVELNLLRRPAAEQHRQPRLQIVLRDVVALFFGHELRDAQRPAAGHDRHLVHAVAARREPGQQRMAGFVIGRDLLFFLGEHFLAGRRPSALCRGRTRNRSMRTTF